MGYGNALMIPLTNKYTSWLSKAGAQRPARDISGRTIHSSVVEVLIILGQEAEHWWHKTAHTVEAPNSLLHFCSILTLNSRGLSTSDRLITKT